MLHTHVGRNRRLETASVGSFATYHSTISQHEQAPGGLPPDLGPFHTSGQGE